MEKHLQKWIWRVREKASFLIAIRDVRSKVLCKKSIIYRTERRSSDAKRVNIILRIVVNNTAKLKIGYTLKKGCQIYQRFKFSNESTWFLIQWYRWVKVMIRRVAATILLVNVTGVMVFLTIESVGDFHDHITLNPHIFKCNPSLKRYEGFFL